LKKQRVNRSNLVHRSDVGCKYYFKKYLSTVKKIKIERLGMTSVSSSLKRRSRNQNRIISFKWIVAASFLEILEAAITNLGTFQTINVCRLPL
jgi:hypothetical protein